MIKMHRVRDFSERAGNITGLGPNRSRYKAVFDKCGSRCHYCGTTDALTIDHKVPTAKGGTDDLSNLLLACRSCNSSKRGKDYDEFIEWRRAELMAYWSSVEMRDCI